MTTQINISGFFRVLRRHNLEVSRFTFKGRTKRNQGFLQVCYLTVWQTTPSFAQSIFKMLALTMRREDRPPRVPVTNAGDEFVDILQVQQLLINENRREQASSSNQSRFSDTFGAPSYYYGGYQPSHQAATSVDDLVALWFSGSTAAGE
ncbi:hypothetical protein JTB14_027706 [Gonioctena quinquepunctata]|nr:hypothetical protein JTB14_027706 [Gonioctena quinquepunctata]